MAMSPRRMRSSTGGRRQRGAVLYIALIMLILLALLGIAALQVSGLEERMASNYRTLNRAFQSAEDRARAAECFVETTVNRRAATCTAVTINPICDDGFDASAWAQARATAEPAVATTNVRAIGQCIAGNASLALGRTPGEEDPNPVFQVTAFATDPSATGANAAIDTIFRP